MQQNVPLHIFVLWHSTFSVFYHHKHMNLWCPQHLPVQTCTDSEVKAEYTIVLGPVVQSVLSLTSLLRVISLTVLADSIHNILIFFAEKM